MDIRMVEEEIVSLEKSKTCYSVCERLAWLYIVKDHYNEKHEAHEVLTRDMAEHWTGEMQNEDGTLGAHWTLDQVKQVMAQYKIDLDPIEFYAVMNSIYSDFCKVAQKYGVGGNLEFYIDMTKAWLEDKDAKTNKTAEYYAHVVK